MTEEQQPSSNGNGRTWRKYFPDGDLWVFGYGSLIWKPPPHFGRVVTVIERSFWETLDDPQKDLESSTTSTVWGAAYHIPASHAEEVHDYLDDREIDGYTVHYTPFYPVSPPSSSTVSSTTVSTPSEGGGAEEGPFASAEVTETHPPASTSTANGTSSPITCMVYIGLPTNPQFLRDPADRDPAAVAKVISVSSGQSGRNPEYLYLLEKALEGLGLGSADGHVTDLVRRVKALERERERGEEEVKAEESRAEREAKRPLPVDRVTHDHDHDHEPKPKGSDEFK
ncbi:hypothetical protein VTN77DRAFT_2112 [Rasamsonia byssochlamydoides]|uniref:uncharacterized protein n=1 Tax=Rasamsonia byssochlamydoides TaxID=89139 RepID=UPI0037444936